MVCFPHWFSSFRNLKLTCVKKQMKAERNVSPNTLRGTLLLRTANSRTLAKHRVCHPEGSLPSSRKKVFRLSKNNQSGPKPPREAARSIQFSRFFLEIWERESAPAELLRAVPALADRRISIEFAVKDAGSRQSQIETINGIRRPPIHLVVSCRFHHRQNLFTAPFDRSFRRKLFCIRQDHRACQEIFGGLYL